MKKIYLFLVVLFLFSCQNKEVLLPKANQTIVADVQNHSPIYFFFKLDKEDTLVEVNQKNRISTTNWLFNIDKRLPLRKVVLEVKKLQVKKETSLHKSESSENYYTYMNDKSKTMAFLPFSNIKYKVEVADSNILQIYFDRNDLVRIGDEVFSKNDLQNFIDKWSINQQKRLVFSFDKMMSFEQYVQDKIFISNLKLNSFSLNSNHIEYIY
jgi:biopolymer transport protein ExbD